MEGFFFNAHLFSAISRGPFKHPIYFTIGSGRPPCKEVKNHHPPGGGMNFWSFTEVLPWSSVSANSCPNAPGKNVASVLVGGEVWVVRVFFVQKIMGP